MKITVVFGFAGNPSIPRLKGQKRKKKVDCEFASVFLTHDPFFHCSISSRKGQVDTHIWVHE